MNERILIVEDEADLSAIISCNLERDGYSVRAALTGKSALEEFAAVPLPDLVLLDVMLPDMSGTQICRELHQDPRTKNLPIIMATVRDEEVDRVVGFELGADDSVVKPFSERELMPRVRAVLRRSAVSEPVADETLIFGRLTVDVSAHRVWVDQDEMKITALDLRLLVTFLNIVDHAQK